MMQICSTFESLAFYRGMSDKYPTDRPSVVIPRRDRRPRNSSSVFHEAADRWFASRFGVPYRSHGVFLTSHPEAAVAYAASPAHVMRVVPLSTYTYCWSSKVSDLLFAATTLADASPDAINAFLTSAGYQEDGLEAAHTSGQEVMLFCERYLTVPVGLLGMSVAGGRPSLIVPAGI